jgi:hypothetical protein
MIFMIKRLETKTLQCFLALQVDGKLSDLELLLTGKVKDSSAGKAALTDTKMEELRCVPMVH